MKAVKILVEPFVFLSYLSMECHMELNQHGMVKIKGLISEENAGIYMKKATEELWVNIKVIEGGTEKIFFYGVLTQLGIYEEGNIFTMTIEVRTGSYLMDQYLHIRSFQDSSFTYETVIDQSLLNQGESCIMREKQDEKIGKLLIQYKETNWAFAKRLAGYLDTIVMPEYVTKGKRIYFGCEGKREGRAIESDSFTFEKGYSSYITEQQSQPAKTPWSNEGFYIVRSRDIYGLGELVLFQGKPYIIGRIFSQMIGEELVHDYYLIKDGIPLLSSQNNPLIRGVSLKATVKKVEKDKVKITIHEDENKGNCKFRWFDYATVYSTPDGTGWYCMPEVGDEVRLTIPDDMEDHGYISSSVHLESQGGRSDPNEKSWKNPQGKEILFTPNTLVLRNNNGLMIELSDQDGINIVSDKNITIQAGGSIDISSSNAEVKMVANSQISMTQGSASILMKDHIDIYGGKINMN